MIKNLVTLGDSWVYGDELGDDENRQKNNWPALVSKHFDLNLVNLGFNGESQQGAIWSMLWWIEKQFDKDSLILLGLTESWRTSWFRASHEHAPEPWSAHINIVCPLDDEKQPELKKLHIGVSACDSLYRFTRQQTLIFFDGISMRYNLPVRYFDLYDDKSKIFGLNHIYAGENAQGWVGDHIQERGHPDEYGHMIIAEKLINYIKSAKLIE
jgi:hypothetical protein